MLPSNNNNNNNSSNRMISNSLPQRVADANKSAVRENLKNIYEAGGCHPSSTKQHF